VHQVGFTTRICPKMYVGIYSYFTRGDCRLTKVNDMDSLRHADGRSVELLMLYPAYSSVNRYQ
jgi:hypothetical protein